MEESVKDDEDIKIYRASVDAIARIKHLTKALIACLDREDDLQPRNRQLQAVKHSEIITSLLDFFQEDPQLLDPHLKDFLPSLISRFTALVNSLKHGKIEETQVDLNNLANVFYSFCKVRGEKVLTKFLPNEPTHMMPTLHALESISALKTVSDGETELAASALERLQDRWKLRYLLLLWIGHLVLTPFPLTSIASGMCLLDTQVNDLGKFELPRVARKLVDISLTFINSPTKERTASASMLAKLALRPDMETSQLLESLISWTTSAIAPNDRSMQTEHKRLFVVEFLHVLLRSANVHHISQYLQKIFNGTIASFVDTTHAFSNTQQQSAVARKWGIKVLRGVIILLLQIESSQNKRSYMIYDKMMMIQEEALEQVIDLLLRSLGDRDTQVRYAASKALSMITLRLDEDMGEEIVEAVLHALREDVLGSNDSDNSVDLAAVNPVRWHGLTLTLSYMLFHRSPSPNQLEAILNALYLTLAFEQRSAVGNSLGTNVRDAANFGLWSLARMYTTSELLRVPEVVVLNHPHTPYELSRIQSTANKLLVSSCLDPSGNVRRGSSAALQELVGRHPDMIEQGISLVQVVDYQAVGLRRRAMVNISSKAAKLHQLYLLELLQGLLGWRGLHAPDLPSRNYAAIAVGSLTNQLSSSEQRRYFIKNIVSSLRALPPKEMEPRHGLTKALSEIILRRVSIIDSEEDSLSTLDLGFELDIVKDISTLFHDALRYSVKELTTPSLRPELRNEPLLSLIYSLNAFNMALGRRFSNCSGRQISISSWLVQNSGDMLAACLKTFNESTLAIIPRACESIGSNLDPSHKVELAQFWLKELVLIQHSKRRSGIMLALASIWRTLSHNSERDSEVSPSRAIQTRIIDCLIEAFAMDAVEARVTAIESLSLLLEYSAGDLHLADRMEDIFGVFALGLDDYTTNERGDVGSLVRLEAIRAVAVANRIAREISSRALRSCYYSVQRLALERLDRVRLQAAQCLATIWPQSVFLSETLRDVTTFDYFTAVSLSVLSNHPPKSYQIDSEAFTGQKLETFLNGIASSMSSGSDSLSSTVQSALSSMLLAFPLAAPSSLPLAVEPLPTVLDLVNSLMGVMKANLTNDRTLLPLLGLVLFIFETGILRQLIEKFYPGPGLGSATLALESPDSKVEGFKARSLLSLIQKAHFKSSNLVKIITCVHIYGHLATLPDANTSFEALKKLTNMLNHPFPKVRVRVSEVLWTITSEQVLRDVDWGAPPSARASSQAKRVAALLLKN